MQPFLFLCFGLMVVTLWGCSRAVDDQATPGTTTPDIADVEQPPEDPFASDEVPAGDMPAEDAFAEDEPVEETPEPEEVESPHHPEAVAPPAEETPAEVESPHHPEAVAPPPEETPAKVESPHHPQAVAPPPEEADADSELDPTAVTTVKWLPEPIEVADSTAADEAAMKPYTEKISATDVTFDMVPIRGGNFTMGSPAGEANRKDDEGPQHEVVIEPFWMGKHEVTWDEYELWGLGLDLQRRDILKHVNTERDELVDAVARPTKPYSDMTFGMGKDGYPTICMTQLAARMYCKWLSAKTGRFYRLPTEAEWEYACRAGTTTAYSFGDDASKLDDYAWHFENSEDGYQKVGLKKPNPWGLYDMHGNVSEWVLDQYIPDYYQQFAEKTTTRPFAPATKLFPRVARGGCWDDDPDRLRSAARNASSADWRMQDPQIPQSIWYLTEVYCPGIRLVRPLKVPDEEEAKLYEPDVAAVREYQEAQAGKE